LLKNARYKNVNVDLAGLKIIWWSYGRVY